jgi:asparagine synthase (glutamine-hydrolysing)
MTHFDLKTLLPALLHVEDRVSMGASLESRVPLLDHRIAELVTTMPPIMRFQGGRSKHILREAVADLVPRAVLDRQDKMGFPVPFNQWLGGPIRDFVCDTLLGTAARRRGFYKVGELERQISNTGKYSRQLWGILSLELWHQTFIDGAAATSRAPLVSAEQQMHTVPA